MLHIHVFKVGYRLYHQAFVVVGKSPVYSYKKVLDSSVSVIEYLLPSVALVPLSAVAAVALTGDSCPIT